MAGFPKITLSPPEIARLPSLASHELRFRVEQRIVEIVVDGLVPAVTMPGHDEPIPDWLMTDYSLTVEDIARAFAAPPHMLSIAEYDPSYPRPTEEQ